jgi:3-phosphoshikimate 1-carboxyvinyltransferase
MEYYGVKSNFHEDKISLKGNYSSKEKPYPLESDWSASSYFYAFSVLTGVEIIFPNLSLDSSQGDKYVAEVFSSFGIRTTQKEVNSVGISYNQEMYSPPTNIDLSNHPDLAPTLIVLVACLKANTTFTGLGNLKIKESDRVFALQTELKKVGVNLKEEDFVWRVTSENVELQDIPTFNTHEDHRIAMSLSLLSVFGEIKIENKEVVVKSFPYFWKELDKLDLEIE